MRRKLGKTLLISLGSATMVAGLLAIGGCSDTLATGYTPRPLGVSSAERRGYYASPFTPEAAAAQSTRDDPSRDSSSFRRPGAIR